MPELWIVADDEYYRYVDPNKVAQKVKEYVQDIFYDSAWDIYTDIYDCSDAPTDSDGTYTFGCGGSTYGLKDWWDDEQTYVSTSDGCAVLIAPEYMYGGGCGGGNAATGAVDREVVTMVSPSNGHPDLLGSESNGDYCFGDPAGDLGLVLQEMGHTWGVAHADGMVWTDTEGNDENHHTPMMLGDGQSNNCDYNYAHNSGYQDRFVRGYTVCAAEQIPHGTRNYSESQIQDIS